MDTKQNLNPTFSLIKGQLGYLQVYKVCLKVGPSQGSERRTLSYSFAVWWGRGSAISQEADLISYGSLKALIPKSARVPSTLLLSLGGERER